MTCIYTRDNHCVSTEGRKNKQCVGGGGGGGGVWPPCPPGHNLLYPLYISKNWVSYVSMIPHPGKLYIDKSAIDE